MKKSIVAFFSRNIKCDKPQRTICKGPKGILTMIVKPKRAFFLDLRGC